LGTNIISCINSSPHTNESETKSEATERTKGRADLRGDPTKDGRNRDLWDPVESRTLPAGCMDGHLPMQN
jgi:hypothetical protein